VRSSNLAFNQSAVALRAYFDEVLRALLPLTPWWKDHVQPWFSLQGPELRSAGTQERVKIAMERLAKGQTRESKLPADVLWMIRVVGVILLAEQVQPEGISPEEQFKLLLEDEARLFQEVLRVLADPLPAADARKYPIWLVTRNRPASSTVWRSTLTIKADAARDLFNISCSKLAWAIVDSGIDARHPAFRVRKDEKPVDLSTDWTRETRVRATYDFTIVRDLLSPDEEAPIPPELKSQEDQVRELRRSLLSGRALDWGLLEPLVRVPHDGSYRVPEHTHGTHVAGILAGDWKVSDQNGSLEEDLVGVCPDLRLYDLRVLDKTGQGDEFSILAALQFIRFLNANREIPLINGVNLSLAIPHDVANYACGQTPACEECQRVVASGVVVVAAAGNDGYMLYATPRGNVQGYRNISISDPGNAEEVITVGATHRYQPHTYGVSYFSSRGPTGDGRQKPDLVAPGEKIKSCTPDGLYDSKDGTSMAAPHVSGVAALLMSRHQELLGNPQEVKRILCETATDLGREKYFQGSGMVDALRALQSV
jgi:hypothetical protein